MRVVGSDSLHTGGGLVLYRNGRVQYEEQFCHGRNKGEMRTEHFFAPSLMPRPADSMNNWKTSVPAKISVDDGGARVVISLSAQQRVTQEILRDMQDSLRAVKRDLRLSQVGVRVSAERDRLFLTTGSTESLIRFLALCAENTEVQVDWSGQAGENWSCVVGLASPTEAAETLSATLYRTEQGPYPWLNLPLPPFRLPVRLYKQLAERTIPHVSWEPLLREFEDEAEPSR